MKFSKPKILFLTLCITLLFSGLTLQFFIHPAPELDEPVSKAINYFEDPKDPFAVLMLDVIFRRFGIEEFVDAQQRYDEFVAENPPEAPLLPLYRRVLHRDNQFQENLQQFVLVDLDQLMIPALYCDQTELSKDYLETLNQAVNSGDYLLTHALLALIWIQENNCQEVIPQGLFEDACTKTAALIGNDPVVDDLELEAAAFLYLADKGHLVDSTFIEQVLNTQNADGGWKRYSNSQDETNEHSTVLALLLLLHIKFPADSYPPMLAE